MPFAPIRLARSLAFLSLALAVPSVTSAQTLTFDPLACSGTGAQTPPSPYTESGYAFTAAALGTWCSGNANYAGTALFVNIVNGTGVLARTDGGAFDLLSISIAHVFRNAQPSMSRTFTAHSLSGTSTNTFTLPSHGTGAPTFSSFAFDASFHGVTSVDFAPNASPYYQFDNVELAVAPEPASIILLGSGLLGVFGVARRRKA